MQALVIPFPIEEDMKLRDDDKEWIRSAVAEEVATATAGISNSLKPHGFRRVTYWLREWGAISALWAVPLSLLAVVITLGLWAINRVSSNATFQSNTNSDIKRLQGDVEAIKTSLARQQVVSQASLPQSAFAASLPELRASLSQVREQKTPVSKGVIAEVQEKLAATSTNAPGYWPAASEFINFREAAYHMDQSSMAYLPRCADTRIHSATVAETAPPGSTLIKINPPYYQDCQIQLDSAEQAQRIAAANTSPIDRMIAFKHCLVTYSGGSVELLRLIPNLRFTDSSWYVNVPVEPPITGQKLTQMLVASNGEPLFLTLG